MTPEPEEKIEEREEHGALLPKLVIRIEADANDHGDTERIVPATKTIVYSYDDHS